MAETAEQQKARIAALHADKVKKGIGVGPDGPRLPTGVKPTIVELDPPGVDLRKLHDGEPWFVFRAQDILSSFALEAYLTMLEKFNPNSPQVESCTHMVNAFRAWQQANPGKVKLPD